MTVGERASDTGDGGSMIPFVVAAVGLLVIFGFNTLFIILLWRRNAGLQKQVDHLKKRAEDCDYEACASQKGTSAHSRSPIVVSSCHTPEGLSGRSPSTKMQPPPRAQSIVNSEDSMRESIRGLFDTVSGMERGHFGFSTEVRSRIQQLEIHCGISATHQQQGHDPRVEQQQNTAPSSSRFAPLLFGMPQPTLKGARSSPPSVFSLPLRSSVAAAAPPSPSASPLPHAPCANELRDTQLLKVHCVFVEENPNESMRLSAPLVHHQCQMQLADDETGKMIQLFAAAAVEEGSNLVESRPVSTIVECSVGGSLDKDGGFGIVLRFRRFSEHPAAAEAPVREWWKEDNFSPAASPSGQASGDEWLLFLRNAEERASWIRCLTASGVACVLHPELEAATLD